MFQGLSYDIAAVMAEATTTGLFVSLCSFYAPSGDFGPSGAPDGLYTAVDDLQDIPCMMAPSGLALKVGAAEMRAPKEILDQQVNRVLLNAYYPQVQVESGDDRPSWRAVIDGINYDIQAAEPDSQEQMTRLLVRKASL